MILVICFGGLGILFALMSLVTWRFQWVGIIAGYEEDKVKDKPGLAKWFGKCCLALAMLSFTLSAISFYCRPIDSRTAIFLGLSFSLTVMLGTIITLSGMSRYYKF